VTICSAKGCGLPALHRLVWNNPRLHTPDREKVWLACADHRESLSRHLDVRGFLRRVEPFESDSATPADPPAPADQQAAPTPPLPG
jgi:hypothetical protein